MGILSKLQVLGCWQIIRTVRSVCKHGYTLLALLDSVKSINNAEAYIKDDDGQLSYNDLYEQSVIMASYLHEKYQIKSGYKVVIVSANSVTFVKSLFAASGLGTDIFLMNPNQKGDYFNDFFQLHKIDLIIGDLMTASEFDNYSIPFFNYNETVDFSTKWDKNAVTRKKGNIVILSSGSTGIPKVEKRKVSILKYLDPLVDIIRRLNLKENKSVLISVPIFHGYGLAAFVLSVFMGQKIRLTKKFNPDSTAKIIEQDNVDCWVAVPLMIQKVHGEGLASSLKNIISGGDVLPPAIINAVRQKSSVKIYNMYGTSETGVCTIATNDDLSKYPDTIGKRISGIQTKVIDADGNPAGHNEVGALYIKCGWSSDNKSDLYISTGDLVCVNSEGYYFYKGRRDDMMVIGGENIYPVELENVIYKHPAIRWVKARSFIDENDVTRIHVDLVLQSGAFLSNKEFKNWTSINLPKYMIPKNVVFHDHEPVTKLL